MNRIICPFVIVIALTTTTINAKRPNFLFFLARDIGKHPGKKAERTRALAQWRKTISATMPQLKQ